MLYIKDEIKTKLRRQLINLLLFKLKLPSKSTWHLDIVPADLQSITFTECYKE